MVRCCRVVLYYVAVIISLSRPNAYRVRINNIEWCGYLKGIFSVMITDYIIWLLGIVLLKKNTVVGRYTIYMCANEMIMYYTNIQL